MTPLEIYYQKKAEQKAVEENVKSKAVKELLGVDSEILIKKNHPGLFMQLLDILDRPGNALRALLVGKLGGLKGLIPFAGVLEELTGIPFALKKEDRVPGTELIETWFGKMPQREGKIDAVDALGLIAEIAVDPLWLVGGAGLTKLGKMKTLIQSGGKMAAKQGKMTVFLQAINAAKRGQPIVGIEAKNLANAIRTVYSSGQSPLLAKTWAQQAARGERAILNIMGKPVISGSEKFWNLAEKGTEVFRKSYLGEKLLAPTRRVAPKYDALHPMVIHETRDVPVAKTSMAHSEMVRKGKQFSEIPVPEYAKLAQDYAEVSGVSPKIDRMVQDIKDVRIKKADKIRDKGIREISHLWTKILSKKRIMDDPNATWYMRGKATGLFQEYRNRIRQKIKRIRTSYQRAASENIKDIRFLRNRQQFARQESASILGQIPQNIQPRFLRDVSDAKSEYEKMLSKERTMRIKISELEQPLQYVHRSLTPEGKEWLASNQERFLSKVRELRPSLGAAKRRSIQHGWMTHKEVDELFRSLGFQGEYVFEPEIHKSLFSRKMQHYKSTGAANAIYKAIKMFRKPVSRYEQGDVLVSEFLDKIGMIHNRATTSQYVIPKDIVGAFTAMKNAPGGVDGFWKLWTGINRFTKGLFTLPNPAYHMKNIMGDIVLGYLDGVVDPRLYADAIRVQKAIKKAGTIAAKRNISMDDAARLIQWPKIKTAFGPIDGYEAWKLSQSHGVIGQTLGIMHIGELPGGIAQRPAKTKLGRIFQGQGKAWETGRNVAEVTENVPRLAHFFHGMNQGMDPMMAATKVREFHFDYGDLSEWEKRIARDRLFFFYTFSRKNLPRQIKSLAATPGKQAVFSHLAGGTPTIQGEGQYYPDWWQEQLVAKTPFRKDNAPVRLMSTGLPIEEAFSRFAAPGVGWTRLRRLVSRNLSAMQPTITKPVELATGKSLYFDQPITNFGRWLIEASPMGRFASSYRQFQNPAEDVSSKIGGFVTGLRTRKFEPEKQKQWKVREIARKYLSQYPKTRTATRYYVSDVNKPELPDDVKLALQVQ